MASIAPIFMSDKRFDKISEKVYQSYPNACILYIQEVMNESLQSAYNERKESIRLARGYVEELQLFHGTRDTIIPLITVDGFDPTKNVTAAYGYGTYFAVHAATSCSYMKSKNPVTYMFLADVLIGKLAQKQPKSNEYSWDNNVDSLNKPIIYTSPYKDGAYPRYIIAFHKNAK